MLFDYVNARAICVPFSKVGMLLFDDCIMLRGLNLRGESVELCRDYPRGQNVVEDCHVDL